MCTSCFQLYILVIKKTNSTTKMTFNLFVKTLVTIIIDSNDQYLVFNLITDGHITIVSFIVILEQMI